MIRKCFCILGILSLNVLPATAQSWNLPATLDDNNSTITFEVDSTWHTVNGTTSGILGKVWLNSQNDPNSVQANISIPVAKFNTDNESRDERLREVMRVDQFPNVEFKVNKIQSDCKPENLIEGEPCDISIDSSLSINGTTSNIEIPAQIIKEKRDYIMMGSKSFDWLSFGIEDPSILVAKVDPSVKIRFSLTLKSHGP